jgi:Rps23 Pro-64 3,4-dihydroxylase Tpa1-like proline 4-hydroxylase
MMGDITCILYLNEQAPDNDGTTIYDEDKNPLLTMYSKFNRMVVFNSDAPHSRNILENFGSGEQSRLVQVIFLKAK